MDGVGGTPLAVALVLINHGVGGTEKRFANLYRHLSRHGRHRYTLFVNRSLGRELERRGLLTADEGVKLLLTRDPTGWADRPPLEQGRGPLPLPGINYPRSLAIKLALGRDKLAFADLAFDAAHFAFAPLRRDFVRARALVAECQASNLPDSHWRDRRYRRLIAAADRVNVASERIRRMLEDLSGRPGGPRFRVSPCSFIDYSRCRIGEKEPLIVFCGKMDPVKNPLLAVEALRRLRETSAHPFQARLLGDGPLAAEVDRAVAAAGLGDVVVRDEHPDPPQILSRALVYLSLQSGDNYHSQALMEAMACGSAVVATDVGETRRLVDDTVGFRVPPDPEAVADRVRRLLEHPTQARTMGEAARRKVMTEQSVEVYGRWLEELYDEAASARI